MTVDRRVLASAENPPAGSRGDHSLDRQPRGRQRAETATEVGGPSIPVERPSAQRRRQSTTASDVVRGQALGAEPCRTRARAIVAIGRSGAPTHVDDLAAILRNGSNSERHRALAIAMLGKINRDGARGILVEALSHVGDHLTGRCALALARIGDASAVPALQQTTTRLTGLPLAQVHFALRMISHRHHLDVSALPALNTDVLEACADELRPVRVRQADMLTLQLALRDLEDEPFGIEWSEPGAQVFTCEETVSVLLLNRQLHQTDGVYSLVKRPMVAAIVARATDASPVFTPYLVVLTAPLPHATQVAIAAFQPNGTPAFGGVGAVNDGRMTFEVRGLRRAGGYVARVSGVIEESGPVIEQALVGQLLHGVRDPGRAARPRR